MANKVLVVDDDPSMLSVLQQLLGDEGFEVSYAYDGRQALTEFTKDEPDLVVTDIMMPRLDGIALARKLREQGHKTPVVLISAVYDDVDLPDVRFIPKPFDIEHFVQVIHRAVDGDGSTKPQA
jgi:DNA-binding response OmpR family regulator